MVTVLGQETGVEASVGLTAAQLKARLRAGGVAEERLRSWPRLRTQLAGDPRLRVAGDPNRRTYRRADAPPLTAAQALALLAAGPSSAASRAHLAAIVAAALSGSASAEPGELDPAAVARFEQREKDAVRALAELAIEVEELAVNGASARALVHNVRIRAGQANLTPIERAGEFASFDRERHQPIGAPIADGARVVVVRPGYVWKQADSEILVARAVVQERSSH